MKIVNLTPHPVTIGALVLPPAGPPPRVAEKIASTILVDTPDGQVMVDTITYGEVSDLPQPQDGVLYVVSRMTADAVPHRDDLVFPTRQVRDPSGRIVGCGALGRTRTRTPPRRSTGTASAAPARSYV